MSIRHVIYTQEPGIDGTGITAIEKEQLVLDVEAQSAGIARVAPPATGTTADQLRVSVNGPRWLPPDTVSPLLFDGAGDGVTNDYAALMQARDAAKSLGHAGAIHLGGKKWRSNTTLTFDFPVVMDGGGMGLGTVESTGNQGEIPWGGELSFPAGVSGIVMDKGSWGWTMRDLSITSAAGSATAPSTDVGVEFRTGRGSLSNVMVRRFSKGVFLNGQNGGTTGYNTNASLFSALRVRQNRGHGLHIKGADANANVFVMLDAMQNTGYGVLDESDAQNKYFGPHFNANTLAAMYLATRSFYIVGVYSEGGNAIHIDTTVSQAGFINVDDYYAAPTFKSGPTGALVDGLAACIAKGITVMSGGRILTDLSVADVFGNNEYRLRMNAPNAGNMSVYGLAQNRNIATFRSDASMPSGFALHGKNPIGPRALPAAATDLASAITLLNALRTLSIDIGAGT